MRHPTTGTLLRDTFWDVVPQLDAEGFVFTSLSRYDPTRMEGLTPAGKAFTLLMQDRTITMTIAGRTKTLTRETPQWEDGDLTIQAFRDVYGMFPRSQQ